MIISFIAKKTIEHLQLTFLSVIISMLLAVPLGIFFARSKRKKMASLFIKLAYLLQSIPPLALMALIIVLLIFANATLKIPITGVFSGIFVLVIYAFLILLDSSFNAYLLEEQKISTSLLFKGVKKAVVSTIGMATLVSLIGSGGLGDLIMEGLKDLNITLILSGALPAAFLGISSDLLIGLIINKLDRSSY